MGSTCMDFPEVSDEAELVSSHSVPSKKAAEVIAALLDKSPNDFAGCQVD